MTEVDPALVLTAMLASAIGGGLGLCALISPAWASRIVNLVPKEGRAEGRSDFRATYGGLFFTAHAFVLWALATGAYGASMAAAVLAVGWGGAAVGRLVSFAADRAVSPLNVFNLRSVG